jgi:hypothetical protein
MPTSALKIVQKFYPQVNRVVDAPRERVVTVSAQDCKAATKKMPNDCAMAKAFKREYDGAIISTSVAYLIRGDKAERFKVPASVSREIVSFDRHKDFAPGEYYLSAPSEAFKMGPRRSKVPLDPNRQRGNAGKRKRHVTAGIRSLR